MRRRISRTSSALALLVLALLAPPTACTKAQPRSEADPASLETPVEPPIPRELAAPSLATLTNARVSPYQHNPVSWRYVSTRVVDGASEAVRVSMTTTPERVVLDGIGLLFKLVVAVQVPTHDEEGTGVGVRTDYRSHVALLAPEGLYLGEANAFAGELATAAEELAEVLRRDEPTWPLPGSFGCAGRVRAAQLPFGVVQGVETRCENQVTPFGPADVTTLWVDRVGFVYREVRLRDGEAAGDRYYDVLASGDVAELAPGGEGLAVEALGP